MMWFNAEKGLPLAAKIKAAAEFYERKYGIAPNLCLVNPKALTEDVNAGSVSVRAAKNILPNHLWLGMEDNAK